MIITRSEATPGIYIAEFETPKPYAYKTPTGTPRHVFLETGELDTVRHALRFMPGYIEGTQTRPIRDHLLQQGLLERRLEGESRARLNRPETDRFSTGFDISELDLIAGATEAYSEFADHLMLEPETVSSPLAQAEISRRAEVAAQITDYIGAYVKDFAVKTFDFDR